MLWVFNNVTNFVNKNTEIIRSSFIRQDVIKSSTLYGVVDLQTAHSTIYIEGNVNIGGFTFDQYKYNTSFVSTEGAVLSVGTFVASGTSDYRIDFSG